MSEAKTIEGEDQRCQDCGFFACICFDDDDDRFDDDDGLDDCSMMPNGQCMQAGTEWCDWDCPRNRPTAILASERAPGVS